MKKKSSKALIVIFIFMLFAALLNIKVTTRQGVDFQVSIIKLPLYLKVLDFFDRHYSYKELVKRIINDAYTDEERVMRIFAWTHQNIKRVPEGFPVIDDHVWHIIIRGYGTDDQASDVFVTLCNYSGTDAFYSLVYKSDNSRAIPLAFVKLRNKWHIFDPFNGVYFIDPRDKMVSIEEVLAGNWMVKSLLITTKEEIFYREYLSNLPKIESRTFNRSNIQSPFRRLIFALKQLLR